MHKKVWANKTESFKGAEKFDIIFWEQATIDAKFSAMWKMIEEFYKIKNKHGYKLRLQRSIQKKGRIEPRIF